MSTNPATDPVSRFSDLCRDIRLVLPEKLSLPVKSTRGALVAPGMFACNVDVCYPRNTLGHVETAPSKQDDWRRKSVGLRLALRYQGREYALDYWLGVAHFTLKVNPADPSRGVIHMKPDAITAASVMANLLMDYQSADDSFEEFCADFGYDTDSRRAERIHKDIQEQARQLRRLLSNDLPAFLNAFADQNDY